MADDPVARHPTGIPRLDRVLGGGLTPGSLILVQGPPGAGKTIFANQICFEHARHQRRALYVTLATESHSRILQQIERLDFYRPEAVPEWIRYLSAYRLVSDGGPRAVLQFLRVELKSRQATLLVIDGLALLRGRLSDADFGEFINELSALAELLGCNMLLLSQDENTTGPELAVVDAWIELRAPTGAYRTTRTLQVHKLRRSGFLGGRHMLRLDQTGASVFPRFEAAAGQSASVAANDERLATGVPDLDVMLGGGVPRASTTLIAGPTGVGKTGMCLHFLSQCTPQQPGLLFGFYEPQNRLLHRAAKLGIDLRARVAAGAVEVFWHPPTEQEIDQLAWQLVEAVEKRGIARICIDGINGFGQAALYPERLDRFLTALTNELRRLNATTLCTLELAELVGGETRLSFDSISAMAENVVLLRYVELNSKLRRVLSLVKVRESRFDATVREFHITDRGIRLGEPYRGVDAVLTGHAQHPSAVPPDDQSR